MSLEICGLSVSRGGGAVLRDLHLTVDTGDMFALIGKNGAGKTTLLETVAGLLRPMAGEIRLDGEDITGLRADRIARLGVALAPEGRRLFPNMTVRENLALGAHNRRWMLGGPPESAFAIVWDLFPDLYPFRRAKIGALSGGQQQMVVIGRALMSSPRLLMLDEPTFGLSPQLTESICGHLMRLGAAGFSVLLVEQNVDVAFEVARTAAILSEGRIIERGDPKRLAESPMFREAMFGAAHATGASPTSER